MPANECTIVVERLAENRYRASCPLVPDCTATAATAGEARQTVAEAVERILRERQAQSLSPRPAQRGA